jgi:hypothetical protein
MKPTISEHDHQVNVIEWCDLMAKTKYPMLRWIYAVPNGGARHIVAAKKLKAEGVKPGVPDLCLPHPMERTNEYGFEVGWYHALYIEMKTKGGTVRPHQKEWIAYLLSVGYMVMTAWTSKEATDAIEEYLNGN